MDNKELLIVGASIVAGVVPGGMKFPDLESFEHFGARGAISGRSFNPDLAGSPVGNLTIDGVTINREGIAIVEKYTSRFDHDPVDNVMILRLRKIANKELLPEEYNLNYYTHECHEHQCYRNLGWGTGEPNGLDGYELWNNAYTVTLEDFKIKDTDLFHLDAKK